MKSVFLTGTARESALRHLLEEGTGITAVITPQLSRNNSRFGQVILTANEFGVPVIPVNKNNVTSTLKALEYDLLISCGFSYIIDEEAISHSKWAINSHPTLLPKYRGYRSGPFIIMNGEEQTGVTVHFLTAEMDRGDIIVQESFDISPFDTTKSIYWKARQLEGRLLLQAIDMLESGEVKRVAQDESQATEFNQMRTPADSLIDWNKPLKELYNEIRACDHEDYPAYFYVDGQKVGVRLWRIDHASENFEL